MPDEFHQGPPSGGPPAGYPPRHGAGPQQPYYSHGGSGYYGPPAVIVNLPPKRRAVWPWVLVVLFVLPFAGCAGLVVLGAGVSFLGNESESSTSEVRVAPSSPRASSPSPSARASPPTALETPSLTAQETPSSGVPVPPDTRFITYTVTGTKAPLDRISVTYTDASGRQRTQENVYIPWSLTVSPTGSDGVGSVRATSLLGLSQLNCSISTNSGEILSQSEDDSADTSC